METVTIRTLADAADCRACVELQREVWNMPDVEIIPTPILTVAIKSGGLMQGAFIGGRMVGFTLAFAGLEAGQPYLYSHALGVHPAYRRRHLGIRLKWAQAQAALHRRLNCIVWTYDPLLSANAHLNLTRLGATSRTYLTDLYGMLDDGLNHGLPTDRLRMDWYPKQPWVQAVLRELADLEATERFPDAGIAPPAGVKALDLDHLYDTPAGVGAAVMPDVNAVSSVLDAAAPGSWACCRVPDDARQLKISDPQTARQWRLRLRLLLGTALARGWEVRSFRPADRGGHYWLYKASGG